MNEEPRPSRPEAPLDVPEEVELIPIEVLSAAEPGPQRPLVLSATVGLIVALVLGLLWAGVAVLTNSELGFLALAIGLGVGAAMAAVAGGRSTKLAVVAVIMSLVGLAAGKYLTAVYAIVDGVVDEILTDSSFMAGFGYQSLVEQGKVDPEVQQWWESTEAGDVPPDELAGQVAARERALETAGAPAPEEEKRAWAEPIARAFNEEEPLVDRYSLGGYDLLWAALVVGAAWSTARPRSA
jgi:hypothetical protein